MELFGAGEKWVGAVTGQSHAVFRYISNTKSLSEEANFHK